MPHSDTIQPQKCVIHIFNPETDYALASGCLRYNPPASILRLRRDMALFPATFADDGDAILILDDRNSVTIPQNYCGAEIVELGEAADFIKCRISQGDTVEIKPWGWNHSLRKTLLSAGIPESLLKSDEEISSLRALSHRRTTIPFNRKLRRMLPEMNIPEACEFTDTDSTLEFTVANPGAYLKAPWSSSGRGVVCTSGLSVRKIREWASGCIRRQGSVMAERGYNRIADFATEWELSAGKAIFAGVSLFSTTPDGRYVRNSFDSQESIFSRIATFSAEWSSRLIEAQRKALEILIAPSYSGPAGIDMLATDEGRIVPCVEINLRQTMGMAALRVTSRPQSPTEGHPPKPKH